MVDDNLEEEIEILEYIYNSIENAYMILRDSFSGKYKMSISQCQELLNDIDYIITEKQEQLDGYDKEQFIESRLDWYKKEADYKAKQQF